MNNMTMRQEQRVNQAIARAAVDEYIERDRRRSRVASTYGLGVVAALVLAGLLALMVVALSGCASGPTRFDDALFTRSNAPMVTVNWTTNVVSVTNTVAREVVQTNFVTVTNTTTGSLGTASPTFQVVPVYVTNTVQVPEVVRVTNAIAPGTLVEVPQLAELKPGAQAGSGLLSGVAGLFGYGGIVSLALSGLGHWYQQSRNSKLAAAATGASAGQQVAEQAAGALTQNVETLLNVLEGSPQGQALLPGIKSYLTAHQATTGTFATIAGLIQEYVDEPAAQQSAAEILKALAVLGGPARGLTGPGNVTTAGPAPTTGQAPRVGV